MRWTTGDRLLIITTRKCLGAQGKSLSSEVSSYDCDDKSELQKWECKNETLLALKGQQLYIELKADETLSLSRTVGPNNHLTVTGSNRGACSRTYRGTVPRRGIEKQIHHSTFYRKYTSTLKNSCVMWRLKSSLFSPSEFYTLEGNAFGKPCAFPFLYKDRWFGDCTTFDSSTKRAWCAVGTRFENDQWGYCPTTCEWEHATQCMKLCLCDERVRHLYFHLLCLWPATDEWIQNLATGAYYQLNVQSILTWFQAEKSCKQQGASLLSVLDPHQQAFVSGRNSLGHVLAE